MKELKYDEIVILNPLQTRYQMLSSRVLIPLYAAAIDGIYRINRAKRVRSFASMLGIIIGIIVLAFLAMFGIYFAFTVGFSYSIVGIIITASSVFGIIKLVKIGKGFGKIGNEGELVVSWSQVKTITVMNVRQENVANRPSLVLNTIAPTYKEIGDWHVLTIDGRDITIPDVDDPHNKLNYVKNRFNLNFS
jgi:hypothetical protein